MVDESLEKRLETLISAERDALLAGDFDRISELVDEKQDLVQGLEASSASTEHLSPLRDGLRRNQELFDQALAGLRNVAARLGDMNRARKSINTYDALGRKQSIDAPQVKRLERRA